MLLGCGTLTTPGGNRTLYNQFQDSPEKTLAKLKTCKTLQTRDSATRHRIEKEL